MAIDFTEKLGPLPVWGWGLIGGGVVVVGYFLMNRGGGQSDGNVSYIDPSGYQTSGIKGGSVTPETPALDNNTLWLSRTAKQVAAALSASPTEVYAALKKFLYGQELTEKEKGWVDTAIQQQGNPPEGAEGISPVIPDKSRFRVDYFNDGDLKYGGNTTRKGYVLSGPGLFKITFDGVEAQNWINEYGGLKDNLTYAQIDALRSGSAA